VVGEVFAAVNPLISSKIALWLTVGIFVFLDIMRQDLHARGFLLGFDFWGDMLNFFD
jgi:hypothetical protein